EARVITFGIPSGTGHIDGTNPPAHIDLLAGVGDEVMTLISEHTVKYRRQLPYRGLPVRVEVGVEKVKGASIEMLYTLYDGDTEPLTATSGMVLVDKAAGVPVRSTAQQLGECAKLAA